MKKKPKKHCPTCHCATQSKGGRARIAKLTAEERSALARKGGLARAANEEARGQAILGTLNREALDSAIKQVKAEGRKVNTQTILREVYRRDDELADEIKRRIAGLRTVPNRSPVRRGKYKAEKRPLRVNGR